MVDAIRPRAKDTVFNIPLHQPDFITSDRHTSTVITTHSIKLSVRQSTRDMAPHSFLKTTEPNRYGCYLFGSFTVTIIIIMYHSFNVNY